MCELLGMSFNLPVRPTFSFDVFRKRGEKHPDGWGLAYYPDESAQIIKEPLKAGKSKLSKFLKDYKEVKSKIFISHVRSSSTGEISHKDTHPFCRELIGKEYIFAHNGTLCDFEKELKLGRFKPIGKTDSEHVFCHLLNCIGERRIDYWAKDEFDWLAEKLEKISIFGKFNCILSDGEFLFCYCDNEGSGGLCYVHRKPPYDKVLKGEGLEIDLRKEMNPAQTGFIIATRILTDEPWEDFKGGELIVCKDGKLVYSNCRNILEV